MSRSEEFEVPSRLHGRRLDAILAEPCPERSKAALNKLVRRGAVEVDGRRVVRSNVRPGENSRVTVTLQASAPVREPFEVGVLHEDSDILVLEKPAGLLTHPKPSGEGESLSQWAVEHFGPLPTMMGERRPGIVHRLDRETSGVLVLARTSAAMEDLRQQFRERLVSKEYTALVRGVPSEARFLLDGDIGPREDVRDRQRQVPKGLGKSAETEVELHEDVAPRRGNHSRQTTVLHSVSAP